jgi:hypothetical protein
MARVADSLRRLKARLVERLGPIGYVGEGELLWRSVKDTVVVIELQKDRKHSVKDQVRFTVNVGISVNSLRGASTVEVGSRTPAIPLPEKCHWRQRLGFMLPERSDVWWVVGGERTTESVSDELAAGLITVALPKIEAIASSEALLHLWCEGRGQGLTEYERRANLARLLITLGRKEEARVAVQELELASIGKSWATAAAFDVRDLRNHL